MLLNSSMCLIQIVDFRLLMLVTSSATRVPIDPREASGHSSSALCRRLYIILLLSGLCCVGWWWRCRWWFNHFVFHLLRIVNDLLLTLLILIIARCPNLLMLLIWLLMTILHSVGVPLLLLLNNCRSQIRIHRLFFANNWVIFRTAVANFFSENSGSSSTFLYRHMVVLAGCLSLALVRGWGDAASLLRWILSTSWWLLGGVGRRGFEPLGYRIELLEGKICDRPPISHRGSLLIISWRGSPIEPWGKILVLFFNFCSSVLGIWALSGLGQATVAVARSAWTATVILLGVSGAFALIFNILIWVHLNFVIAFNCICWGCSCIWWILIFATPIIAYKNN